MSLAVSVPLAPEKGFDGNTQDRGRFVAILIVLAAVLLMVCSSARHYLLRSGAFDLGFFDQAIYLISQNQTPISSLHGFHVLGDHASFILYPLALLYMIWADPHMLL